MLTKDEQFDLWFEKASRDDLLAAVKPDREDQIENDFLSSRQYLNTREDYIVSELESSGEMNWFDEDVWYDPEAVESPVDSPKTS